jgi:hypothetical protein
MWVKSESGQILNLSHARLIELFPSGDDKFIIVVHFVGSERAEEIPGVENPLFVELCEARPEKEAQALMKKLCGALEMKEAFVDFSHPA